jgi:hypothetical protein
MKKYTYAVCICEKSQALCNSQILNSKTPIKDLQVCPSAFTERQSSGSFAFGLKPETRVKGGPIVLEKTVRLSPDQPPLPARKSLLLPAHFRMITKPLCNKENAKYLACAKNSYRASPCVEPLAECSDGKWLE